MYNCTTVEMAENANFHPLCIIILFCTTNCRSWIWVSAMVDAVQWYPFAFSFLMQLTRCCYSTKWLSVCKCDLCTESHIQLSLFAPQTFHTGEKTDTCTTLQHCRQRACCYVSNEQKQGITAQDSSSFIVMDFWALLSICRCPLKHAICQVDQ